MKHLSKRIVTTLTIILLFAFSTQNFSQLKNSVNPSKWDRYVANLRNGINSENIGLKKSAIQFTCFYNIKENIPLLVRKYNEEKNQEIKDFIALSLYIIGDSSALKQINLTEESILNKISVNMFVEIYKYNIENE